MSRSVLVPMVAFLGIGMFGVVTAMTEPTREEGAAMRLKAEREAARKAAELKVLAVVSDYAPTPWYKNNPPDVHAKALVRVAPGTVSESIPTDKSTCAIWNTRANTRRLVVESRDVYGRWHQVEKVSQRLGPTPLRSAFRFHGQARQSYVLEVKWARLGTGLCQSANYFALAGRKR